MGVEVTLVIVIAVLIALLAIGVPVAFSLLTAATAGILLMDGVARATAHLANIPFSATFRYALVVVPMFIFMGILATHGGIARESFALGHRFLRRLPGGLGLAAVASCAGFAAVCGSSPATVASVGRMALPEMRRYGWDPVFAAGIVGSAGTLGVLIPPSIVLVIYGIVTGESIGQLLLAGFIPGLMTAIAYGVFIVVRVKLNPRLVRHRDPSGERSDTVQAAIPTLVSNREAWGGLIRIAVLFTIVVGGIYSGVVTATESAALGAAAALVMVALRMRVGRSFWRVLGGAMRETGSMTSMIFAILVAAVVLSTFLTAARVPSTFIDWVAGLDASPALVIVLLLAAMIPLGMFLDPGSILIVTMPLIYPVVRELGFDGVWFGILTVKMMEIGLVTPPVGVNAYIVAGVGSGVTVEQAFRGILPFVSMDLVVVALLFTFPELVLWLPRTMGG
jgi:C4-dicarboxylate transporter DctM subunit